MSISWTRVGINDIRSGRGKRIREERKKWEGRGVERTA